MGANIVPESIGILRLYCRPRYCSRFLYKISFFHPIFPIRISIINPFVAIITGNMDIICPCKIFSHQNHLLATKYVALAITLCYTHFSNLPFSILISLLISSTIPDNGTQFLIYTKRRCSICGQKLYCRWMKIPLNIK